MKVYFLGGMPRAGSTLLLNLLAQNPNFHVSRTSGLLELVYATRNQFSHRKEFQVQDQDKITNRLTSALRGLVTGWYFGNDITFDNSRGWLQYFELLSSFWPDPKVIVPIRDIRDSIASSERLWRKHPLYHDPDDNPGTNPDFQYVDGRVLQWINTGHPTGLSLARIYDTIARDNAKHILFIRYEDLCADPIAQLRNIYSFTGEKWFKKHKLTTQLKPNPTTWTDVLPPHCGQLITNTFSWYYTNFYPDLNLNPQQQCNLPTPHNHPKIIPFQS